MRHYCTYFDQHYLPRALALYYSLKAHSQEFQLWALCFDELAFQRLTALELPEVRPISLEEFTRGDPQLLAARESRTPVEYYFTCSPSLPLFVLNHDPDVDLVTYLDADLYFYASPEYLFDEVGSASIAIISHRFPENIRHLEENGIYNVGWLTFRRDAQGLACLQRWRSQCLEWCFDRIEGTRYADQGYLNDWPATYSNLVILQHLGANLAPWNISNYRLTERDGRLWVENDPLVFFHFQGLICVQPGIYKINFNRYRAKTSQLIKMKIYVPYVRMLEKISILESAKIQLGSVRDYTWAGGVSLIQRIYIGLGYAKSTLKEVFQREYIFPRDYREA